MSVEKGWLAAYAYVHTLLGEGDQERIEVHVQQALARAWDEGHERVCGIPARLCGIHGNPYRDNPSKDGED